MAKGVKVRPADIVDHDGNTVRANMRNPARSLNPVNPDGEVLPVDAWLLRNVRKGNLVALNDAGDVIQIDDFGNEIA